MVQLLLLALAVSIACHHTFQGTAAQLTDFRCH